MGETCGTKIDVQFFSLNLIEKYFPKVFEFFRKSTVTSNISPFNTEINLPCGF